MAGLTIVASAGERNELGRGGDLCWHIPEDLRHFKELTTGGAVIMGRSTWESLPKRPLPGRTNIVVTRNKDYEAPGAVTTGSLEEAVGLAGDSNTFIIGGESVYRQALLLAERLELTRIFATDPEADKYFPAINTTEAGNTASGDTDEEDTADEDKTTAWRLTDTSETLTSKNGLRFRYETWERV